MAGSASSSARQLLLRHPFLCREKLVKAVVELLSTEVAEKALVAVTLRLLAMLMMKYDWRMAFATEGGVWAVLAGMQQHASSALVQQAGLAVSVAEDMLEAGRKGTGLPRCGEDAHCPPDCLDLAGPEGAGGSCGWRARRHQWEGLAPEPG